jgi:phage gp29-like protein
MYGKGCDPKKMDEMAMAEGGEEMDADAAAISELLAKLDELIGKDLLGRKGKGQVAMLAVDGEAAAPEMAGEEEEEEAFT